MNIRLMIFQQEIFKIFRSIFHLFPALLVGITPLCTVPWKNIVSGPQIQSSFLPNIVCLLNFPKFYSLRGCACDTDRRHLRKFHIDRNRDCNCDFGDQATTTLGTSVEFMAWRDNLKVILAQVEIHGPYKILEMIIFVGQSILIKTTFFLTNVNSND